MSKLLKYSANINCIQEEDSYFNFLPPSPLPQWATAIQAKTLQNLLFFAQLFKQVRLIKLKSITDTLVVEKLNFIFGRVREKRRTELRSAVHELKMFSLACSFLRDDCMTGSIESNSNPTTFEELSTYKPRSEFDRRQMMNKLSYELANSTVFLSEESSNLKELAYRKMGKSKETIGTSPSKSQLAGGQSVLSSSTRMVSNLLATRKVTSGTKLADNLKGFLTGSASLVKLIRNGSVQDIGLPKEASGKGLLKPDRTGNKEFHVKQNVALLSFLKLFKKKERECKVLCFSTIQRASQETETRRHKVYSKEVARPKAGLLQTKFKKKLAPTTTSMLSDQNSTGQKNQPRFELKGGIHESMMVKNALKKYESSWGERNSLHSEITRGLHPTENQFKTSFGHRTAFSPFQEKFRNKRSPDKYSWGGVPSSPNYRTFHQFIAPDYRNSEKKAKIDYNPVLRMNMKSRDRRDIHGL